MTQPTSGHWLSKYACNYHAWQSDIVGRKHVYRRPLGLVELSFDTDGTDYGGRADMTGLLTLEIRHKLSKDELRQRIALAWACLRLQHVMLQTRVHQDEGTGRRDFVVNVNENSEEVLDETLKSIVWVEDGYTEVDGDEFHRHSFNVSRIIDPAKCLSQLQVLPLIALPNGSFELRFLIVMAHQISDGLSAYNWFRHFIALLNMPITSIEQEIDHFRLPKNLGSRLPPAQEDLYPPVAGNKARERWFWAIMRVLRHIGKGLPPTIANPLCREHRLEKAASLSPLFNKVFDYSEARKPPMNSFHCTAALSKAASTRLIELCRAMKVSVGAGCFALAGISMMDMEEQRYPNIPDADRKPFAASFPLNPRAFYGFNTPADSCMLAFSDGIIMPFLSSSLPVDGRLRLIALQANRQLRVYQKRLKSADANMSLEPHSPGRLLANGYIYALERIEAKLPESRKSGMNPQGALPRPSTWGGATCGVSSVGSTAAYFSSGAYDLNEVGKLEGKDFAADYRNIKMGVRARDNEFLVGSSTDHAGIVHFGVSYDGNSISEDAAEAWAEKIKSLLEKTPHSKL
ncbi:hypothetical protein B0J11DRAFT_530601 [Dendryphion nanum]|uniref:Uncharacterized protein n=1 Tax=Dendryphion nanum TaxID=256645 RepID=A0A9P9DS70_9PLEO|nr:hypothetical protein B0J11DRAFT_530601 [Dendryphion nanum]